MRIRSRLIRLLVGAIPTRNHRFEPCMISELQNSCGLPDPRVTAHGLLFEHSRRQDCNGLTGRIDIIRLDISGRGDLTQLQKINVETRQRGDISLHRYGHMAQWHNKVCCSKCCYLPICFICDADCNDDVVTVNTV